jgi:hypothetical protein
MNKIELTLLATLGIFLASAFIFILCHYFSIPGAGRSADVNAIREECGSSVTQTQFMECKAAYVYGGNQ